MNEKLFEELGIPKKHLKETCREDRFIALVHKSWLKNLFKHSKLGDFVEKSRMERWNDPNEDVGNGWTKIFIKVLKKRDAQVMPLPRVCLPEKNEAPLLFPQLMQYISSSNFKSLWKEAYKKYSGSSEFAKDASVTLSDYNEVLRETITRTYGCSIIDACNSEQTVLASKRFEPHLNILPAMCAVETLNAIFVLHIPSVEHTLYDCVTFSPDILRKCFTKPLFVIYQLLQCVKSLHNRSITLGDVTLNDIYINEDLWIQIFPQLLSNLHVQDANTKPEFIRSNSGVLSDCRKFGKHNFDSTQICQNCGYKTYDKIQISNESLQELSHFWVEGKISNFTYITALNRLSGRKYGDPHCHYVFPWVTDFASRCGKNWRDLRKSKYRLNKGDPQLDLTYTHSQQTQVPHHVSDVLSAITYYVYMARRTSRSVLCKNVRTNWVPAEYPSSIQRMQEWTPDECIPEFFTDPLVFKSIHDDLDDLEVPPWSTSPEDFVQQHREILECAHISERLHHWIDLTFGYKLSGSAAIKAKNVCLPLVDGHTNLTKSGIVQLFTQPHPPKSIKSIFFGKAPPKIHIDRHKRRTREHSVSSSFSADVSKSEEEFSLDEDASTSTQQARNSPLAFSRFLSRSRTSLSEDAKENKSRSSSLGPKNPTFTSHISKPNPNRLSIQKPSLSTGTIYLPKEYNPVQALVNFENFQGFISKTFYSADTTSNFSSSTELKVEHSKKYLEEELENEGLIQNAFTNRIFTESFEANLASKIRAVKSYSFPIDHQNSNMLHYSKTSKANLSRFESQFSCNYYEIIMSRRIKELQILGCLIVEIFMAKQLRALGHAKGISEINFTDRLKACIRVVQKCKHEIPLCVKHIVDLLLPDGCHLEGFKYPVVTELGLPPPRAHLFLEPLLHCLIPFPKSFPKLYGLISTLKYYNSASEDLEILYHFDCNGHMCKDYETLERTKVLFVQNISECKVKRCTFNLEDLLSELNVMTEFEVLNVLLPYIKDLLEEPSTSVLAAWYLFDLVAVVLGPQKTSEALLSSMLKLYDTEINEATTQYNGKIAKLYHHSFLLRLMVRFGLKCFLEHFVTSLVEAVGGYRDYEKVDFSLHTHSKKIVRKPSNLRSIDSEQNEISPSDESSSSSEKNTLKSDTKPSNSEEPEIFEFEQDVKNEDESLKSLIEHLELNANSDLPFNHSAAEEALDATLAENIDQLRSLEELDLNMIEDYQDDVSAKFTSDVPSSPVLPLSSPPRRTIDVNHISCEIGSKNSGGDVSSLKSNSSGSAVNSQVKINARTNKPEATISDMSADSLIWLSHRLGPVLTARYLARNLLKMLTLCYVGRESLVTSPKEPSSNKNNTDLVTIASSRVVGDQNAIRVLDCLASITALYGEQLILFQYFPHMSELIALCKKRLSSNLEGGLISSLALLQHIIPYLSDSTFMDHLQDVILKNILHPVVRLLGSTKYTFPNGYLARSVLARKYLDTLYLLSLRMGPHMTRTHLAVPALQRFFMIFDKANGSIATISSHKGLSQVAHESSPLKSIEETHYIEVRRDGTTKEWAVGGRPLQISHVRVIDTDSTDSLSPTPTTLKHMIATDDDVALQALEELKKVFTSELAHTAYVPFLNQIGLDSLESALKNHSIIRTLCQEYEQEVNLAYPGLLKATYQQIGAGLSSSPFVTSSSTTSYSIGCNVALVGNRIDVQNETHDSQNLDVLNLISNRMENTARHLRGNWLAYWEHEIGRSEKNIMFNFKQIRLQCFSGHLNSVKSIYVLDNENSFMSGSRDKTVKLWSLRSSGDGSNVSSCQWTYTSHRKSVLSLTFLEGTRRVASTDSVVHIWDPYLGENISHLESPRFPPINVLKSTPAPSSLLFAAATEGVIRVIDTRLCNYVYDLKVSGVTPTGIIRCMVVSQSGNWLAAGQSSGHITVLDTRTGLVISTWKAHENEVLQLVTHGENTLISSSLDQTTAVWNVQEGKARFFMNNSDLRGVTDPVHCLNVYHNELISGTTANRIGVHTSIHHDASYSSTKLRSDAFKGLLTSMAVLPLNRLLLLGADNGNITLLC